MILSRLILGCGVLAIGGLVATSVFMSPAFAISDGYEDAVREDVFCSLFDDPVAFRRFEVAYRKIKKDTGRDPSIETARAAAGLGKYFCLEG